MSLLVLDIGFLLNQNIGLALAGGKYAHLRLYVGGDGTALACVKLDVVVLRDVGNPPMCPPITDVTVSAI